MNTMVDISGKIRIDENTASLLADVNSFLTERGAFSYLVGGFVRDTLLSRKTADIDIAIYNGNLNILVELANRLNAAFVLMDKENQVSRIVSRNNQWHIDFSILTNSIEDDLARRDFAINAMALPLNNVEAEIIDPYDGISDLKKSVIKVVSNDAFTNDPARIIRAVRLAAELEFKIDSKTVELIKIYSALLETVARERIREEFCRILNTDKAAGWLIYMDSLGVLTRIIPELESARGISQPMEHYWDVLNHSIETVRTVDEIININPLNINPITQLISWINEYRSYFATEVASGVNRRTLLKIAALLHDISKPETKMLMPDGKTRFLGHSQLGSKVAGDILQRLRFSRIEVDLVTALIQYHLRPTQMCNEGLPTKRAIYRFFRDAGDAAIDILVLSLADHLATRGPSLDMEAWRYHTNIVKYIIDERDKNREIVHPPKLLDGNDIMKVFHLPPGPLVGTLLESVREAQATGEIVTGEEAIKFIAVQLEKQGATNAS